MSDERAVTTGDDPLTRTAEAVGGALGSAVKSVSETAQEAARHGRGRGWFGGFNREVGRRGNRRRGHWGG